MSKRGRSPEAKKRRATKRRQLLEDRRAERMARPRPVHAEQRRVVRLADGRTGRLFSVPSQSSHVSNGAKARVLLASGAVISVPLSDVTVIREVCVYRGCDGEAVEHAWCAFHELQRQRAQEMRQ